MSIPTVQARFLDGRKGLVVGIANQQSIAWGCARAFGADLAITPPAMRIENLTNNAPNSRTASGWSERG